MKREQPERHLRKSTLNALRRADAYAVENTANPGTPDVECALGLIELKYKAKMPPRPTSMLTVGHFTPKQRAVLKRRWHVNQGSFVFLQVANEYILLAGDFAAEHLHRPTGTVQHIRNNALFHHFGNFPTQGLYECLYTLSITRASRLITSLSPSKHGAVETSDDPSSYHRRGKCSPTESVAGCCGFALD